MVSTGPYSQPTNYTHTFDIPDLEVLFPKELFEMEPVMCYRKSSDFSMFDIF